MELFSLVFMKEEGWTKELALEEVNKQELDILTTIEDDKLLVCVTKEIEDEKDEAEVVMLSDSVYCICKIPEDMKKEIKEIDLSGLTL